MAHLMPSAKAGMVASVTKRHPLHAARSLVDALWYPPAWQIYHGGLSGRHAIMAGTQRATQGNLRQVAQHAVHALGRDRMPSIPQRAMPRRLTAVCGVKCVANECACCPTQSSNPFRVVLLNPFSDFPCLHPISPLSMHRSRHPGMI